MAAAASKAKRSDNLAARFAALAFVSGSVITESAETCSPAHFPSVLTIHGTEDLSSPYEGMSSWKGMSIALSSVSETTDYWTTKGGCGRSPTVTLMPDLAPDDGTISSRTSYSGCANGRVVESIIVQNGDHSYPGGVLPITYGVSMDFNANTVILEFFSRYQLGI